MFDSNNQKNKIYQRAITFLAAREHSQVELRTKLVKKFGAHSGDTVTEVLAELSDQGIQSDIRFAEALIRSRITKGYGPFYIQQEARAKGIDTDSLSACDSWLDADWEANLSEIVDRRHTKASTNRSEWTKSARQLARRGFSGELVRRCLGDMPNS